MILDYIDFLSAIGTDAVILQDLGALYRSALTGRTFRSMPVHR